MSEMSPSPVIHRHRTAMVRHDLSQPVSLLVRHGIVKPGVAVFDYGCGQGDDLRILAASGIEAAGWDPHFRPDAPRIPADVVNLGFVLNVIEHPAERKEALAGAWALTRKVLAVSTMIVGQVPVGSLRPHGDGYFTSRGTFQRYFQQGELRALISQTLDVNPVAVAPGIFFAFREPEDEQEFLLNRRAGRRAPVAIYRMPRPPRENRRTAPTRPALPERLPVTLAEIAAFIRQRGRAPQVEELSVAVSAELAEQKVSLARAVRACLETSVSEEDLRKAVHERREDLLVHQALGLLNRSATASRPSAAMVRDIKAHFGSQKEFATEASRYLYALSDEGRVREVMNAAVEASLGVLDHRGRLVVDSDRADDLPGVLRCYLGCATFLSGEPTGRHVLRIDAARKRVALWPLVDPDSAIPSVQIAVRVDLKRQDVHVRPDDRRLVRRADLFGLSPRSRYRRVEAAYRKEHDLPEDAIFHKLEGAVAPGGTAWP